MECIPRTQSTLSPRPCRWSSERVRPSSSIAAELDQVASICAERRKVGLTVDEQRDDLNEAPVALIGATGQLGERDHQRAMRAIKLYGFALFALLVTTAVLIFVLRDHLRLATCAILGGGMLIFCCVAAMFRLAHPTDSN